MSVLKYFKNTHWSPPIGRQALSVIFFFKFATRSLEKKKGGLSPTPGATGACRPLGGGGRQALFINPNRHSLCHLSPKIQEKSWSACRVVTSF